MSVKFDGLNEDEKSLPPQKVVVPKGMINPEETTVIEIPARFHRLPIVIAKRKQLEPEEVCSASSKQKNRSSSQGPTNKFSAIPIYSVPQAPQDHCSFPSPKCSPPQNMSSLMELSSAKIQSATEFDATSTPQNSLDETEQQEKEQLQEDLEDFQKARRKLIESTSKVTRQDSYVFENGTYLTVGQYGSNPGRKSTKLDPTADKEEYMKQLYETLDLE